MTINESTQLLFAVGTAALMFGLFIQAQVFRAFHDDPPATYKLFAVRDRLIRLAAEKSVDTNDPTFVALYSNVTILLRASRCLSGPTGWQLAENQGKAFARGTLNDDDLVELSNGEISAKFQPVMDELEEALDYLLRNHFGIFIQMDAKRREIARIQKQQAKELLKMMKGTSFVGCRA